MSMFYTFRFPIAFSTQFKLYCLAPGSSLTPPLSFSCKYPIFQPYQNSLNFLVNFLPYFCTCSSFFQVTFFVCKYFGRYSPFSSQPRLGASYCCYLTHISFISFIAFLCTHSLIQSTHIYSMLHGCHLYNCLQTCLSPLDCALLKVRDIQLILFISGSYVL